MFVLIVQKRLHILLQDHTLRDLLYKGVAYHHSGLPPDDRALVEQLYLMKAVHILCCTSTLAHGVNLPAHLVIIKGNLAWDIPYFIDLFKDIPHRNQQLAWGQSRV